MGVRFMRPKKYGKNCSPISTAQTYGPKSLGLVASVLVAGQAWAFDGSLSLSSQPVAMANASCSPVVTFNTFDMQAQIDLGSTNLNPGGAYFDILGSIVNSGNTITASDIQNECGISNVANFVGDGPTGTFAGDTFYGVTFRGEFGGQTYDYTFGLSGATGTTLVNTAVLVPTSTPVTPTTSSTADSVAEALAAVENLPESVRQTFTRLERWKFLFPFEDRWVSSSPQAEAIFGPSEGSEGSGEWVTQDGFELTGGNEVEFEIIDGEEVEIDRRPVADPGRERTVAHTGPEAHDDSPVVEAPPADLAPFWDFSTSVSTSRTGGGSTSSSGQFSFSYVRPSDRPSVIGGTISAEQGTLNLSDGNTLDRSGSGLAGHYVRQAGPGMLALGVNTARFSNTLMGTSGILGEFDSQHITTSVTWFTQIVSEFGDALTPSLSVSQTRSSSDAFTDANNTAVAAVNTRVTQAFVSLDYSRVPVVIENRERVVSYGVQFGAVHTPDVTDGQTFQSRVNANFASQWTYANEGVLDLNFSVSGIGKGAATSFTPGLAYSRPF